MTQQNAKPKNNTAHRQSVITLFALVLLQLILPQVATAYTVQEGDIAEAVVAHVQKAVQLKENETLDVDVINIPGIQFEIPSAQDKSMLQITTDSRLSQMFTPRTIVRVKLKGPAQECRELGVPVKINITKPVWVADQQISAHQVISPKLFHTEQREISQIYHYALGPEKPVTQYEARVTIQPGEILDARKLIQPPLVKRNETIHIIISNHAGMNLVLEGQALQDGQLGQSIRVRQKVYQQKNYMAKVIAKNRVLVEI